MATQATEATQAHADTPPDEQNTPVPAEDAAPSPEVPETPPKRGRPKGKLDKPGSAAKLGRRGIGSLIATEISNDCEVHVYIVQRVLDSLEKTAAESLKKHGVFRMNLFTAKLRTKKARQAGEKRVCGKDITLKEKPATSILKVLPTKAFKHLCL